MIGSTQFENISRFFSIAVSMLSAEGSLLRAELRESKDAALAGIIFGAAAAFLWIFAIAFILAAIVVWLVYFGLSVHVSVSIVAGLLILAAGILTALCVKRFRDVNVVPEKTITQVKKDLKLLGNGFNG